MCQRRLGIPHRRIETVSREQTLQRDLKGDNWVRAWRILSSDPRAFDGSNVHAVERNFRKEVLDLSSLITRRSVEDLQEKERMHRMLHPWIVTHPSERVGTGDGVGTDRSFRADVGRSFPRSRRASVAEEKGNVLPHLFPFRSARRKQRRVRTLDPTIRFVHVHVRTIHPSSIPSRVSPPSSRGARFRRGRGTPRAPLLGSPHSHSDGDRDSGILGERLGPRPTREPQMPLFPSLAVRWGEREGSGRTNRGAFWMNPNGSIRGEGQVDRRRGTRTPLRARQGLCWILHEVCQST